MINIKKTPAKEAENEISEILTPQDGIFRNDFLIKTKIDVLKLSTTLQEIPILLNENLYLRPHFESEEKVAKVPVIFSNIDINCDIKFFVEQNFDNLINSQNRILKISDYTLKTKTLDSLKSMGKNLSQLVGVDIFNIGNGIWDFPIIQGRIDEENIHSHTTFFKKLKPEKQKIFAKAINKILDNKEYIFFQNHLSEITLEKLIKSSENIVLNHENILNSFNQYDGFGLNNCILLTKITKEPLDLESCIKLLIFHNLGFDIIAISNNDNLGIGSFLKEDFYDTHFFRMEPKDVLVGKYDFSRKKHILKFEKRKKLMYILTLFLSFIFVSMYSKNNFKFEILDNIMFYLFYLWSIYTSIKFFYFTPKHKKAIKNFKI